MVSTHHFRPLEPGLNAFIFDFDPGLLAHLQHAYRQNIAPFFEIPEHRQKLEGVYYQSEVLPGKDYYLVSYDTYPLLWVTNHSQNSYQDFHAFFTALGLETPLRDTLAFRKQLMMYSGFFVIGDHAREKMWHYDYRPGAQGMTLITPLFDWQACHGQLLYRRVDGSEGIYTYKKNQAILLGEGVLHSTQPYPKSDSLRVLVSLTLGSDQWKHWDILKENIAEQSHFYVQPCGHEAGCCDCFKHWQQKSRWWRLWRQRLGSYFAR
jgi:hypothetical protein